MSVKSTEVAKKGNGDTVVANTGYDYGKDAGAGFEGTKGSDLAVPFLSILQPNSPQVEEKEPPGAESGMIFNTVTQELSSGDVGVPFLPCHKEQAFVEWVPRNKGGGFVGLHDPEGDVVAKAIQENDGAQFGKLKVGDNELVETYYIYGLILDENNEFLSTNGFAVISFTSTKIKPYRGWTTSMYLLKGKPPLFANRARVRTIRQKNEHGTFYNFQIVPLINTWVRSLINPSKNGELIDEAKAFRDMVTSGMARAAFNTERVAGEATSGDGGGDEEVPF